MISYEAKPWFTQAESDLRTAKALRAAPHPMIAADVGCHVAAMCAQVIEKSIKGYVIVNGGTPSMDHRPDKYLPQLLAKNNPLLRHKDHHAHLAKLFDGATKHALTALLDWTPGGQGHRTDVPNTEYPWQIDEAWAEAPAASHLFHEADVEDGLKVAQRILVTLHRLGIAASRGAPL